MRYRPPRLLDWLTSLLLLGGIALSAEPHAAEAVDGAVVHDLYYGEVLFQFYKQDDFTALTHLLAARDANRVSHHEAESELLLGGLYASYGQHDRAAEIFQRLLANTSTPSVRDRAWFYLGKMRYQRGLYNEALESFARVGKDLPEALAAELPMLLAQSHMAMGDFDQAERLLARWDAPDSWLAYARYNLGVALVRLNRLPEGARLLDRVGRMDAETVEQKSLRDKANLALGYAWLQANDSTQAKPVLQRVRLHGPFASKALLGVGWADAINKDYRGALVPWLDLVDRDLMDSAVQESFLAVPYAMGRLDANGSAVEHYQRALGNFDSELANLDLAIRRARTGKLIPALLVDDKVELGRWYWQLKTLPDDRDTRYIYPLLADNAFQEGVKNYRDLAALAIHLDGWRQKVETFSDMVDARSSTFDRRLPDAEKRLATIDVEKLRQRRDDLAARLSRAQESRDIVALATTGELDHWQRLQALEQAADFNAAENATLRDRHRLLRGVVIWDLDRQFKDRVWREQRALRELDHAIAETGARLAEIQTAARDEPQRFDDFAIRIAALAPRIAIMQASIGRTLQRQEGALVARAVEELESQKQRLTSYRVQARFALATIYDRAGKMQAAVPGNREQR